MNNSIRKHIDLVEATNNRPWSSVPGFNNIPLGKVKEKLEYLFPDVNDLTNLLSDGRGPAMKVFHSENTFDYELCFTMENAGDVEFMERKWNYFPGRNYFWLDNFKILDGEQKRGIGKRVLFGTFQACQMLDINHMSMHATGMGCYVWAKAGFLPMEHEMSRLDEALHEIRRHFEDIDGHPVNDPELWETIFDRFAANDQKSIWRIVDIKHPVVREIFRGDADGSTPFIEYNAFLNLDDRDQTSRLEEYCK